MNVYATRAKVAATRRRKSKIARWAGLAAIFLAAMAGFDGKLANLRAQSVDVSTQFPEAAQVTADFPGDVERWGAFNVLHQALFTAAPRPMSKAAYAKFSAYEASYNGIVNTFIAGGAAQRQAYRDFNAQCDKLFTNADFGRSVLEKYHLTALVKHQREAAAAAAAAQAPPNVAPGAAPNSMPNNLPNNAPPQIPRNFNTPPARSPIINEWPYPQAFPLLLIFLAPVALFTWLVLQLTGSGRRVLATPAPEPGGLPALPESMRVVTVPGVRYAVYVLSGVVLQKESNTYRQSYSTTTPGQAINMGGGNVQYTAPTTSTFSMTTREEIIWVRTPDGHEKPWTLYDSQFQSRPGQMLSILVRPLKDGTGDIILGYNHATGTMEMCPAMKKAHGTGGFLWREIVQWTANLTAAACAAIVTCRFLPIYYQGSLYPGFIIWWLFGTVVLVTISFLIVTPLLSRLVHNRRDASFKRKYFPGLRQYFEQGTAALQRTFGRG
jgi:hypothetical protein